MPPAAPPPPHGEPRRIVVIAKPEQRARAWLLFLASLGFSAGVFALCGPDVSRSFALLGKVLAGGLLVALVDVWARR